MPLYILACVLIAFYQIVSHDSSKLVSCQFTIDEPQEAILTSYTATESKTVHPSQLSLQSASYGLYLQLLPLKCHVKHSNQAQVGNR